MTESKQSKPYVAVRVIEAVKNSNPPGRFLVKYPGGYLECDDVRAREKAKQAFQMREHALRWNIKLIPNILMSSNLHARDKAMILNLRTRN